MNRKSLVCAGALLLLAAGIVYAAGNDVFLGTWKLNEAKSKIAPDLPKNSTVVNRARTADPGASGMGVECGFETLRRESVI